MKYSQPDALNPETVTIGEIVASNYNTAGVFRKYGLDFCCGGGITLQKACEKHNVYIDEILSELKNLERSSSTGQENFMAWEVDYLISHIIDKHHSFVRTKTEEIAFYAEKVARVHGERRPENIEIFQLFNLLGQELITHLEAEEETVFPAILEIFQKRQRGEKVSDRELAGLKKELEKMVDDHEGAGQLIAEIKRLSNNFTPPEDACATYRILYQNLAAFEEDLHKHVHLENNILFKKAEKLLG